MDFHYNAFISYRHAEVDSRIAEEVQTRLERYRLPAAVQKRTGIRRIDRIFRDKSELPLTSDLNDDILAALRDDGKHYAEAADDHKDVKRLEEPLELSLSHIRPPFSLLAPS